MHSTEAAGRETPKPRSAAEPAHRRVIQREKRDDRDAVAQRKPAHSGHPAVAAAPSEEELKPKVGPEGFPAQRKALSTPEKNSASQDRRPMAKQMRQLRAVANGRSAPAAEQGSSGSAGLPGPLKSGVEQLSGMAMDHVRVHRNSSKPAQLNAHAYAQGSDIHVAPGQEKHLPHEAWHVVQQAQGRVKPTLQAKGVAINDDTSLEKEADAMGAKAHQAGNKVRQSTSPGNTAANQLVSTGSPVQRTIVGLKGEHLWGAGIGRYVTDLPKDSKLKKQINRLHGLDKTFPVRDLADLLEGIRSGRYNDDLGDLAEHPAVDLRPVWRDTGVYVRPGKFKGSLLSASPQYSSVLSSRPRFGSASNKKSASSKKTPVDESASSSSSSHGGGKISSAMRGHFKSHGQDLAEGARMVPSLLSDTPEQAYASRFVHQQIAALLSPMATVDGIEYTLHRYAKAHRHELVTLSPTAFAEAYFPGVFDDRMKSITGHVVNGLASYALAYPVGGYLYERWFAQGNARLFVERFLMKRALRLPVAGLSFLSLSALTKFAEIKQSRADSLLLKAAFPEEYALLCELGIETRVSSGTYKGLLAMKKAGEQKAKGPPPGVMDYLRSWIAGLMLDATLNHAPTVGGSMRRAQDIGSKEMAKPRVLQIPSFAELPGPLALTKEYAKNMKRGGSLSAQILMGNFTVLGQIPSAFWQLYGSSPSQLSQAVKSLDLPHDQLARELMRARMYNMQQGMFNSAVNLTLAYGLSWTLASPVYNKLVKGAFRFPSEKFLGKSALRGRTTFLAFGVLEGIDMLGSLLDSFQHGEQLKHSHPSTYKKLEAHKVQHLAGPSVHRVLHPSQGSTSSSSSSKSSQGGSSPSPGPSVSSQSSEPRPPTVFTFGPPELFMD